MRTLLLSLCMLVYSQIVLGLCSFSLSTPFWVTTRSLDNSSLLQNGLSSFSLSTLFWASANLANNSSSDYSICPLISTLLPGYSDYRITPVENAPNPSCLQIPIEGIGYAWFRVEGLHDSRWLPVTNAIIYALDEDFNQIPCQTSIFPYQFLGNEEFTDDPGVFAVPIPHNIIGNGTPGASESISVISANGIAIAPENQASCVCEVIPYQYDSSWGYRLYGKMGLGATGGVVTGTGFIGGGSGSTVTCRMSSAGSEPDWTTLTISRRDDLFGGVRAHVGPPYLINLSQPEAEASVKLSFPYERTYDFSRSEINGFDALMAFYLMAEPAIVTVSPMTCLFLSCLMETLIASDIDDYFSITHVSDELGLDIEGNLSFSIPFVNDLPLNLQATAGLGTSSHIGVSAKTYQNGIKQSRLYGLSNFEVNLGLRPIFDAGRGANKFYPQKLSGAFDFSFGSIGHEVTTSLQEGNWLSTRNTSKLKNPLPLWQLYDLPLYTEYDTWFEVSSDSAKDILYNCTEIPRNLEEVDNLGLDQQLSNETFRVEACDYLNSLYAEQQGGNTLVTAYGVDALISNSNELSLDFEFPLPNTPGLVVSFGGGIELSEEQKHPLMRGSWVKGYPYLSTEMPIRPTITPEFSEIMTDLWSMLNGADIYDYLLNVLLSRLTSRFLSFVGLRNDAEEILTPLGSSLIVSENSIPAGTDSILFRYWDWGDQSNRDSEVSIKESDVLEYHKSTRALREEAIGMHYGIGGFYSFEANSNEWAENPILTIRYSDEEIDQVIEEQLSLYWEDEEGNWQVLPSVCVPDSNLVRGTIPYFTTYTLAPCLPTGTITLISEPDSLLADGQGIASIESPLLYYNDGSIVTDGTEFTIQVTGGSILEQDENPSLTGYQIAVQNGMLAFNVQAGTVPLPLHIEVTSVQGIAFGVLNIPQYTVVNMYPPTLLSAVPEHGSIRLSWQTIDDPQIVGYKIYYNMNNPGPPYNGTSNLLGCNSPVQVGSIDSYTLSGLSDNKCYYVAISSIDAYGCESPLSNELVCQPTIMVVDNLGIINLNNSIRLSWQPVYGASSYKILRGTSADASLVNMDLIGETVNTFFIDDTFGNHFFYRIIAVGY